MHVVLSPKDIVEVMGLMDMLLFHTYRIYAWISILARGKLWFAMCFVFGYSTGGAIVLKVKQSCTHFNDLNEMK